MIEFTHMDAAGAIPWFLEWEDPRSATQQLHEAYAHGGGWRPFPGFTLHNAQRDAFLTYPEDPDTHEISRARLREELIIVFENSWVAVVQPTGAYEISRMD